MRSSETASSREPCIRSGTPAMASINPSSNTRETNSLIGLVRHELARKVDQKRFSMVGKSALCRPQPHCPEQTSGSRYPARPNNHSVKISHSSRPCANSCSQNTDGGNLAKLLEDLKQSLELPNPPYRVHRLDKVLVSSDIVH